MHSWDDLNSFAQNNMLHNKLKDSNDDYLAQLSSLTCLFYNIAFSLNIKIVAVHSTAFFAVFTWAENHHCW